MKLYICLRPRVNIYIPRHKIIYILKICDYLLNFIFFKAAVRKIHISFFFHVFFRPWKKWKKVKKSEKKWKIKWSKTENPIKGRFSLLRLIAKLQKYNSFYFPQATINGFPSLYLFYSNYLINTNINFTFHILQKISK